MPDEPLKSSYELAMERLKAKDREEGIVADKPLNAQQKTRIAELRQEAKAKLAELEILHRKNLSETGGDPAKVDEVEQHYRIDRRRIESNEESAVRRVKEGR